MTPVEGGSSFGFSVARRDQDGVIILVIRGEVDAETSTTLAPEFEAAAVADGPVVIDLCGASFMDSAGLYAVMVLRRRLAESERRTAVAYWPQGAIATIFHVSGADELFEVHASRAAAVLALRD
jgi:anti-anti-sigma factor